MRDEAIKQNVLGYYYGQMWSKTPDNRTPLKDDRPFCAYMNPETGSLIILYMQREKDQQWRNHNFPKQFPEEWKLEELPQKLGLDKLPGEFWKALHPSDAFAELLYQSNNRSPFQLREALIIEVANPTVSNVLSNYVDEGDMKSFSKKRKDRGFFSTVGNSLSRVVPLMVAQNPKKVIGGEPTDVELNWKGPSQHIKLSLA